MATAVKLSADGKSVEIIRGTGEVVSLSHAEVSVAARVLRDHLLKIAPVPVQGAVMPSKRINEIAKEIFKTLSALDPAESSTNALVASIEGIARYLDEEARARGLLEDGTHQRPADESGPSPSRASET